MAATNRKNSKTQNKIAKLTQGLPAAIADQSSWQVSGKTYTKEALLEMLTTWATDFEAVPKAEAALAEARRVRKVTSTAAAAFLGPLQSVLLSSLGATAQLELCGIMPRKQAAPLSTEAMAERNEKILATRKARNTMGPKQKAKIKGVVPPKDDTPKP